MKYRKLGNSNLEISEVSFGCMSLDVQNQNSVTILKEALNQGINFFDTADLYDQGQNEILLGNTFKNNRQEIIIATKVGNEWRKDGNGWDWNPSKKYILKAVEHSLQRLQTDYIDLYQLHGGTIADPIDETIEAFELLKEQGKIRYYGISSIRPNVIREYVKRSNISSVMMQYSLLDRRPEETCFQLLQDRNIGVLARGTLAKGLLAGKPLSDYLELTKNEVDKILAALRAISRHTQNASSATAISFVLRQPTVNSAVVGFRTIDQLNEVFEKTDLPTLYNSDIKELVQKSIAMIYRDHR